MKSRWETNRDRRIFIFDLSGFGADEIGLIRECDEADAVIMAEPLNSVLVLNDVRGTTGSVEVVRHLQLSAERSNPYIIKAAVVGISGTKWILLQIVNRFAKLSIVPFDDFEKAKDWLVQSSE